MDEEKDIEESKFNLETDAEEEFVSLSLLDGVRYKMDDPPSYLPQKQVESFDIDHIQNKLFPNYELF